MTYDSPEPPIGEAVAVGPRTGGPAGVPDAAPAPHHHPAVLAVHPERRGSGYRQRLEGAPFRPAQRSRSTRVSHGIRGKEVPMA